MGYASSAAASEQVDAICLKQADEFLTEFIRVSSVKLYSFVQLSVAELGSIRLDTSKS